MLVKLCVNGHEYKANNNRLICPKCGESLNFKVIEDKKKKTPEQCLEAFQKGEVNFSEFLNSLPRISWFFEIQNNENVPNSGKKWEKEELLVLEEFYEEQGEATPHIWKEIAEGIFQRSVYSIEHIIRFFKQGYSLSEFSLDK